MKITTKIYLKLFLAYGLTFGFLMSLWNYIDDGEINFLKTIFMILFFGGFMSWTSVKDMKKSKLKFEGTELTEEDFDASQSECFAKKKSIQEIYDLLKSNEVTKNWKFEIENSQIVGKTRISWASWGEKIIISDLGNEIKIESKPVLKTTFFDNGRNRENVLLIKGLIEKQ